MIDYEKIERIAAALESRLGITAGENEKGVDMNEIMPPAAEASEKEKFNKECADFEEHLDEIEQHPAEQKCTGQPDCTCPECVKEETTSMECTGEPDCACPECTQLREQTASRMASLKRLIKLARSVKANDSLTAAQKQQALKKIEAAGKSITALNLNQATLNRKLTTTSVQSVKTGLTKLNDAMEMAKNEHITVKDLIKMIKDYNKDHKSDEIDLGQIQQSLFTKPINNLNASTVVALGVFIGTLLKQYKAAEARAEKEDKQNKDEE